MARASRHAHHELQSDQDDSAAEEYARGSRFAEHQGVGDRIIPAIGINTSSSTSASR
jgi:hypothetical protein